MKRLFLSILVLIISIVLPGSKHIVSANNEDLKFKKPTTLEELRNASVDDLVTLDKYDSRDYDIVTPIKSQRAYGRDTCWAYATMAASETSILREGLYYSETRNLDFSGLNHTYITFNNDPSKDPLGLTIGDSYSGSYNRGYSLNGSGERMLMWVSPNHEDYIEDDRNPIMKEPAFLLEDIIQVDNNDILDIKKAIARYGAVTVVYKLTDWHEDYYYYNSNVNVFDGDIHAVTIVGWDDTIDKNLYKLPSKTNGGWIVKNSWGSAHKEGDGYFMMSYDSPITDVYAFDFASKDKYDYNYHYDSFTIRDVVLDNNSKTVAIFPAKKSSISKKEILKSVNVTVVDTESPKKPGDGTITAEIYTNVNCDEDNIYSLNNNPISSNKPVATITRKITHQGSYTLELDKPIELEKGTYFSVVINVESKNDKFKVALSAEGKPESRDLTLFELSPSNWKNCGTFGNPLAARIKAFTKLEDRTETVGNDLKYTSISLIEEKQYRYGNLLDDIKIKVTSDGKLLEENTDHVKNVDIKLDETLVETTSDLDVVGTTIIKISGKGSWTGTNEYRLPLLVGFLDLTVIGEMVDYKTLKIVCDASCEKYEDIVLPKGYRFTFPTDKLKVGENVGNYLQYDDVDSKYYRKTMYDVIVVKTNTTTPKIDINEATIKLDKNEFVYNGNIQKPTITVDYNNQLLELNRDYIVNIDDSKNTGIYTIQIIGKGKFSGTKLTNYRIVEANINDVIINYSNNFVYNGNEITPQLNITFNGQPLLINTDYKVSYENNINAGKAKIIITGLNNFKGSITKVFDILKAENEIKNFQIIDGKPSAESLFGDVIFKYYSDKDCLNEIAIPTTPGTYYVKAVVLENDNFVGTESSVLEFIIKDEIIEKPEIENPINPDENPKPEIEDNNENVNFNKIIVISVLSISLAILVVTSMVLLILFKRKK